MKIAFSTQGNDLTALVDTRFGRSERFLIVDTEQESIEVIENTQNRQSAQGAGIQSATHLIQNNVNAVVTGQCGPKAFALLNRSDITVYPTPSMTISEALDALKNGQLSPTKDATVEGHWGEV
ncbi:NifB/NifX family molybdenum-iron cluster-binding protein [Desulfuromonas acetoxidans]|uniref:Dinitrogenase iron-molybdenum cofactor biosynthesis n=1 Tax=Desulfuromonas acetoxidans (strain DSM 684 / 11070) TaxID=281689 RepID=Q1JWI1_DESA6|nr:NifB/NifX family molybdenum-iron cluster-binding protein [Desulfuromonas acetoxidans]EAT14587.1 Dinitrogenase iron-molybdenum cofactor biosynthesis [Desulfuromonas acetoxidans DSM 684]MBF0646269.1 NifB/NifX family molybdenum-iron cluster-binding protein [Desulfuromonas acetoxidans]NVD25731.1 NifB/NifX family molybdenum-iron cluster-binding protein [Desulfuromonas acetoxidans]NVE17027.1 NifB/NifX family molybdenum-iron cluster-binding protein [Desulfuromonas acetoxidans]